LGSWQSTAPFNDDDIKSVFLIRPANILLYAASESWLKLLAL
jgi:hypothetical protein